MRKLEVSDVGPVEKLQIPIPADGGLVVLAGKNGAGKSCVLQAVAEHIGQGGKVVSRAGSLGATVSGLGARLTVGRRAQRAGELEVQHLEGNDIALLVDPGFKEAAARDAARVRALLRLCGAHVDRADFEALVGGKDQLDAICRTTSLDPELDAPTMVAKVKADIEAAARKAENEAASLSNRAQGALRTLQELGGDEDSEGFDVPSIEEARRAHEQALRELAETEGIQKGAAKLLRAADEAREALAQIGSHGTPDAVAAAERTLEDAGRERARLQAALAEAKRQLDLHEQVAIGAKRTLDQEQSASKQREALERAIQEADGVSLVSDGDLAFLRGAVADTRRVAESAAVRERTATQRAEAQRVQEEARRAFERGLELRNAAQATERVLMDAVAKVAGEGLELQSGRLMVRTPERGLIQFDELSDGQRWRRVLEIGARAVGENGLLVISQVGYEGLDPERRAEIAEIARELRVVILTAEAASGELRAEVLQ